MNKKLLISLIILAFSAVYANVLLTNFEAKSVSGNVVLYWQTSSEINLKNFVILRKPVSGNDFTEIEDVKPKEVGNYEYVDRNAYKTSGAVYVYKIKIVCYNEKDSYSAEIRVANSSISSAKRTWGSIKALFR